MKKALENEGFTARRNVFGRERKGGNSTLWTGSCAHESLLTIRSEVRWEFPPFPTKESLRFKEDSVCYSPFAYFSVYLHNKASKKSISVKKL